MQKAYIKGFMCLRFREVLLGGNDSFIISYLRQPNKQDKQEDKVIGHWRDMGGQLMEVEINGNTQCEMWVGFKCITMKKNVQHFCHLFANLLYGITYFNLMIQPIAKCLDMIATFSHKIIPKKYIMSPYFLTLDHFNSP